MMKTICCVALSKKEWEIFLKTVLKKSDFTRNIVYEVVFPVILPEYGLSVSLVGALSFFGKYLNSNIRHNKKCKKQLRALSDELKVVDFTNLQYVDGSSTLQTLVTRHTLTPHPDYEEKYSLLKDAVLQVVGSISNVNYYKHTQIHIPVTDFKISHVCLNHEESNPTHLFPTFRATFTAQKQAILINSFTEKLDEQKITLQIPSELTLNVIGTATELYFDLNKFVGELIL